MSILPESADENSTSPIVMLFLNVVNIFMLLEEKKPKPPTRPNKTAAHKTVIQKSWDARKAAQEAQKLLQIIKSAPSTSTMRGTMLASVVISRYCYRTQTMPIPMYLLQELIQ